MEVSHGLLCQCPLGLYLIVTMLFKDIECLRTNVSMPSRAYTSLLRMIKIATIKELTLGVNALSGLYLIVTKLRKKLIIGFVRCQCPLGLIPHCYPDVNDVMNFILNVSMPSRAYTSLLQCYLRILNA